jgi:hypothetical protein
LGYGAARKVQGRCWTFCEWIREISFSNQVLDSDFLNQIGVIFLKPIYYIIFEFFDELYQFIRILFGNDAYTIIFGNVSFRPAGIKILSILFSFFSKNQWHRLNCAIVLQCPFRFKALSI